MFGGIQSVTGVQGSHTKCNFQTTVRVQFQTIDEMCAFNIMNIDSYDLILRMSFLEEYGIAVFFHL